MFKETCSAVVILDHTKHNYKPCPKLHTLMEKSNIKLSEVHVFIKAKLYFRNHYHFRVSGKEIQRFGRTGAMGTREIEKRDVDHENVSLKVSQ